jgi:rubrerythrin
MLFIKTEGYMQLKGTKTEKNLLAAFAGESQARNRYTYFASAAKKEGFEQIAAIFLETAENEKEHAKIFFKMLKGRCRDHCRLPGWGDRTWRRT